MSASPLPRVAVIGAGSSGIVATKVLAKAGFDVTCFESTDRVGGLWVFRGTEESARGFPKTAAYRSLHINTSRARMEYADYPMPASYPDFPSHAQIAAYFDDYIRHFDVRRHIRFESEVRRAEREADGAWLLTLASGESQRFGALLVANGHHWDPAYPDPPFPGSFDGLVLHSHDFVDAEPFRGKRVVVLGMGNSAMDIAVEASFSAERVFLAARRGVHVVPKMLFGRPLDQWVKLPSLPFSVKAPLYRAMVRLATGPVERYGLPKPDHALGEAHPTISSEILARVASGAVLPKPNIAALAGDRIRFTDGSEELADALVYCTGYKVTFPFFERTFLSAPNNDLPLFRRVWEPSIPNLAFIGLLQPLGAIMPLAEAQSHWVADTLAGRYSLPSAEEMRRDMAAERKAMFARYVASPRHTMQVDFDEYLYELDKERRRGERRAG